MLDKIKDNLNKYNKTLNLITYNSKHKTDYSRIDEKK